MSADAESDDFRWGQVLSRLRSIDKSIDDNSTRHGKSIEGLRDDMTEGFLRLGREVSGYGQKLDSHIGEDDGRFSKQNEAIGRLEESSPATPGLSGISRTQLAATAGGATGLVLVLNWLRELFTATGGTPPS